MIKAIIFDLGGVVIENPNISTIKELDNKKIANEFERNINNLDIGKVNLLKLEKSFMKKFGKKINLIKILIKNVKKAKINKNIIRLILKLKKNYKMMYLSNMIKEERIIFNEKGLFKPFNFGILSYKVRLLKPHLKIYKLAIKKLKLKPDSCVFIDDTKINLVSAKKLGINTILFKNSKQLIEDLKKYGVRI